METSKEALDGITEREVQDGCEWSICNDLLEWFGNHDGYLRGLEVHR